MPTNDKNLVLDDYHLAVVASDGIDEPELTEPVRILKQAGAQVDVLAQNKETVRAYRRHPEGESEPIDVPVDKKIEDVSPDAYDAVLVSGGALDADYVRLEQPAQEFVRSMRKAGKPIFCFPVSLGQISEIAQTAPPPPVNSSTVWSLVKETFSRWMDINAPRLGAALAYYTVFSMAPLLVVVVGIAGLVFGRAAAQGQIVWQIQDLVGPEGAKAIQALLAASQKPSSGVIATVVGLVVLLFGASGVFNELRDSLNYVWGVKTPGTGFRGMLISRFFSFAMVLAVGFLLLVSLVLSAVLAALGKYLGGYLPLSESWLHLLTLAISFIVFTALFALLYKVVPDLPVDWGDVWIGAAVTSLLFSLGKFLIGFYLGKAAVGSAYGAAGSLVAFLAWVYYSAQIFFLGAEFTHIFANRSGSHREDARPGVTKSTHTAFLQAQRRTESGNH
jgi:membrane protein